MANRCQLCPGEPRISVDDWRSVWLGMSDPDAFYLEWGRCCNEKPFDEPLPFFNSKTGEEMLIHTPQELWVLIAGEKNKDEFGKAVWY